ncbi:UNVERIFIED_CONTAM: Binding partner of ACD11 1 [Sesamum calycinum]|uniref:Binding partner of ACD11 1 n=2 Tax=Sesamum TaxID=4181 RepID=A0AAW2QX30_9LAMI
MNPTGYTVEIANLSPNATEKDVCDFFAFCGAIQHVEIVRAGEYACTAYVTFKNPHAVETAILVNGATILDRPVCITRSGHYGGDYNLWNHSSLKIEDENLPSQSQGHNVVPSAGRAVSLAQDAVKSVAAKGYVLGKGALNKAKAFDESHQVSATAVAKVTQLSERVGLTDKIVTGVEAARAADQRYHISNTTRSVVSATGKRAASAANAVANSGYFSKGALWLSGALSRASQVAADLGGRSVGK